MSVASEGAERTQQKQLMNIRNGLVFDVLFGRCGRQRCTCEQANGLTLARVCVLPALSVDAVAEIVHVFGHHIQHPLSQKPFDRTRVQPRDRASAQRSCVP